LRQIARIHDVRVRRDDEHRAVDDEWRGFLAAQNARGERPRWTETGDICRRDFLQTAVAGIRVVFGGHQPLAVVGRRGDRRGWWRSERSNGWRLAGRRGAATTREGCSRDREREGSNKSRAW